MPRDYCGIWVWLQGAPTHSDILVPADHCGQGHQILWNTFQRLPWSYPSINPFTPRSSTRVRTPSSTTGWRLWRQLRRERSRLECRYGTCRRIFTPTMNSLPGPNQIGWRGRSFLSQASLTVLDSGIIHRRLLAWLDIYVTRLAGCWWRRMRFGQKDRFHIGNRCRTMIFRLHTPTLLTTNIINIWQLCA